MQLLYNFGIYLYRAAISVAALRNSKAKAWISGRRNWLEESQQKVKVNDQWIWFHCASLGEFEQGRPVIEAIRKAHPEYKILLTFFSPSGYQIRHNYSKADCVMYLPLDTTKNASAFLNTFNVKAAFFVKYEFWMNFLFELKARSIKSYLISGIFRENQRFFKFYGGWFRKGLKSFDHIFVQDQYSHDLLKSVNVDSSIAGDTRFDRVNKVVEQKISIPIIENFVGNHFVIVGGSTWPEEEDLLNTYLKVYGGVKLILAPHEVDSKHISHIKDLFKESAILYSEATFENVKEHDVLIVDHVGMLSQIYHYSKLSLIGGGFGKGIHNVLEAAVFGVPVVFGPIHQKFKEARDLLTVGGAKTANTPQALVEEMHKLVKDGEERMVSGNEAKSYVARHSGATKKILEEVKL